MVPFIRAAVHASFDGFDVALGIVAEELLDESGFALTLGCYCHAVISLVTES